MYFFEGGHHARAFLFQLLVTWCWRVILFDSLSTPSIKGGTILAFRNNIYKLESVEMVKMRRNKILST